MSFILVTITFFQEEFQANSTVRHAGSVWFKNKASLAELYIACTILKYKFQGKYQGQNFKAKASCRQGLNFKGKGLAICPQGKLNKDQRQ